jgi:CHAT domain-containing protein
MQLIQESIKLNKEFLSSTHNHPLTFRVQRNLSLAYRNLSSLYFDLGDYENAKKISLIAYNHAKDNLLPNSLENFSAITSLAEIKIPLKEFKSSLELLDEAELIATKIPGDNFVLKANMFYSKGLIYQELENYEEAKKYLVLSNQFHQKAHPDEYSRDRLYGVLNLSLVLASLNEKEEAISILKKAYDYFLKNEGEQSSLTNAVLVALSKTSMLTSDYEQSLKWSTMSLALYEKYNDTIQNSYDKSHFEENKAEILVLNAKSKYLLSKTKDSVFLKTILLDVKKAITTLEERRALLTSVKDVNRLIDGNHEAFDFAKQINLELYRITNNQKYLNDIVSLHESALYNRIRARLNLKKSISFSNLPEKIIERENKIKDLQNSNLEEKGTNAVQFLIDNNNKWTAFIDTLKQQYPKYYKMRYATIEEPLDDLQNRIPDNTTLIRYLYIDDILYAFVFTKTEKNLFKLNTENLEENILKLNEQQFEVERISPIVLSLYNQLWRPFEKIVTTEKVIIIPDRDLFNLSFEMLTPKKINSFSDFATNSLLSKHIISYNYSLLLIDKESQTMGYDDNFVAFVPEFNDKMKDDYRISIQDSLDIDKTYLTLLPQPFTRMLAQQSSRLFNGESFLNENSTENIFKNSAKEHKIIHIGTHAESNNISPELSRLVFAKSMDSANTDDNYLYTYEIYNTNLSSNLAILTACETGKPTYQAGEGMISLAHAFNYAGSESILTSLWKIDEQSSAKIIESFYKYISKGWAKDKALQQAKLDYIATAEGRTAHPQYWAGLVLIGDTSPIKLQSSSTWIYWLLGCLAILLVLFFFFKKRHRK